MLWQPLIALSLYANDVLHLKARYRIEPRRRVDKQFDFMEWEIWTPDGTTEVERPITGTFNLDTNAAPGLRHFLEELSLPLSEALNTRAGGNNRQAEEAANRLQWQPILPRRLTGCWWGSELPVSGRLLPLHALPRRAELPRSRQQRNTP